MFGLGGVKDRAISIAWHMQPLRFSIWPELAKLGKGLPAAVRSRLTSVTDLFPMRNAQQWLLSEVPQHLGALGRMAPPPSSQPMSNKAARKHFATQFMDEASLRALLTDVAR
uniref:Uncharacterized protein n=1 Tax=Noctiluca scintillans TaxID=2966 RepID=A0A7S0ZZI3_NOCSC